MDSCPRCHGKDIAIGRPLVSSPEYVAVGPKYRKDHFYLIEPILVDICRNCGEVVRTYVKEPGRDWVVD